MKYILLIKVGELWREVFSGGYGNDSYDKCIEKADKLDNQKYMIVGVMRVHSVG